MGISWKNGGNIVEILWRYRGKYGGLWLQPWCDHKPLILGQSASQSSTLLNLRIFCLLSNMVQTMTVYLVFSIVSFDFVS